MTNWGWEGGGGGESAVGEREESGGREWRQRQCRHAFLPKGGQIHGAVGAGSLGCARGLEGGEVLPESHIARHHSGRCPGRSWHRDAFSLLQCP